MAEESKVDPPPARALPRVLAAGTHHLLLIWLIFVGVIIFGLFVAWDRGVPQLLFNGDKSRISWAIAVMFICVSVYCARRIYLISTQLNAAGLVESFAQRLDDLSVTEKEGRIFINGEFALPECVLADYLRDRRRRGQPANGEETPEDDAGLFEVYASRLKGPHDIGWFLSDIMIKLGLLGTIVGFVLMLGSVVNVTDFDADTMQGVLRNMSSGMGTALYTTFVGLLCSILTGAQFYLLDQGTEEVLRRARHFANIHVPAGAP